MVMNRNADKEALFAHSKDETKNQSMFKLKSNIAEREKKILELRREIEELQG